MKIIIQKYLMTILNIFYWMLIFPLLYILTVVDLESIHQFNFSDIYTSIYFVYLFIWSIWLILLKFIKINNNIFREETLYTIKSIFYLSLLVVPTFFLNNNFLIENAWEANLELRIYWKLAFLYLSFALIVSPLLRFIKNSSIRENFILSRKIFWIISFIFFFRHWLEYFTIEYTFQTKYHSDVSYLKYVYDNLLLRFDALSWVVAWFLMLILWITSNKVSIKLLSWKWWKILQSLVYPTYLLSIIHVAFASRFDNFYIFLLALVVILRATSYLSNKTEKNSWETTKYLCIPCWYIYDESVWDPDSWIEPGTKFEDIPDDWRCPVCGVTKSDFEPYYWETNTVFWWYLWEVVSHEMLTDDVLEINLKINSDIDVIRWQYAILLLNDFDWEFSRAYSIVSFKHHTLTFWIKLKETWRAGRFLKTVEVWDTIKIKWIYWDFILKDTDNPKVFIATGTWLSPIMNMISWDMKSKDNQLFFWAQAKKDLFYLDEINEIQNLKTHIYLSREETEEYNYWRIDLTKFKFDKNTEFYICWNPWVVAWSMEYLKKAWYKNVFSEKFN